MIKQLFLFFLSLILLTGCTMPSGEEDSVFFYPRKEYQYNTSDGIIASESRDLGADLSGKQRLSVYLKGPVDVLLANPFPEDVFLISAEVSGETVLITMSDSFASLSGAPLILACACIGRTACDIYGVSNANVQCQTLPLDGKPSILINESTVIFHDSPMESTQEGE